MANRLSENESINVLVLEAGQLHEKDPLVGQHEPIDISVVIYSVLCQIILIYIWINYSNPRTIGTSKRLVIPLSVIIISLFSVEKVPQVQLNNRCLPWNRQEVSSFLISSFVLTVNAEVKAWEAVQTSTFSNGRGLLELT